MPTRKGFARSAFMITLTVTLVFALTPHPPVIIAWDKAQHGLAFSGLALFARLAMPEISWLAIGFALAGLGGAIELMQLIPALHHNCDLYDWLADVVAIALGISIFSALRWGTRTQFKNECSAVEESR